LHFKTSRAILRGTLLVSTGVCCTTGILFLQSSDGQEFQVDEDVAFQSITVKNMIEDTGAEFAVPLPNVNGVTLSKVLEYCNKHRSGA